MYADRVRMPAAYGEVAGTLPWEWAEQRLSAARNYWLCTTLPAGHPHAMPVWGRWLAGAVAFSTDPASRKARNLAARPEAVAHLESGDDAVIVQGRVAGLVGGLVAEFCERYEQKYAFRPDPQDANFGLYQLCPTAVLAWRESDFPASATRFTFPVAKQLPREECI